MQSTIEPHSRQDPRGKSRMPLEVFSQNLLALFDGVVTSATIASAKSGESSDEVIATSLDDTLFELRVWLKCIKRVMPGAESARNSLRILGKLEGPLTARFLNMLGGIETDLTELSAETTDNTLYGQVVLYGTSSSSPTNNSGTEYLVGNFAQHVAESKPQSINCICSDVNW